MSVSIQTCLYSRVFTVYSDETARGGTRNINLPTASNNFERFLVQFQLSYPIKQLINFLNRKKLKYTLYLLEI